MDVLTPMPLACPHCAARMPETAAYCPGCGISMSPPARATGRVGWLAENIAGALAYLTLVPAIVFLLTKPYSRNLFVRFHSIQCLIFWAAALLTATLVRLAGFLLMAIPIVGPLLFVLVSVLGILAAFSVWAVLIVKGLQGEMFKLPWLGDFAERYANSL